QLSAAAFHPQELGRHCGTYPRGVMVHGANCASTPASPVRILASVAKISSAGWLALGCLALSAVTVDSGGACCVGFAVFLVRERGRCELVELDVGGFEVPGPDVGAGS